ncbi:MAG: hypothetical protein WCJ52_06150 [Phenylobacterium sp.]|uniref:hypothetical protein n=1 Tax=Phenylobacterium sp. TaxID=1871053 RepID=UPI00301A5750
MKKSQFKLAGFGHQSPIGRGVAAAILLLAAGCSPPQWASKKEAEAPAEVATVQPASGKAPEGVPAPDWAANLYGKMAAETFPGKGACVGNLDGVRPANDGIGRSVFGWAWDSAAKTSVRKFVLVNGLGQVVAAGDGGWVREDVPRAMPDIPDPKTGWVVRIGGLVGPFDAYGVLSDGTSLCSLGRLLK